MLSVTELMNRIKAMFDHRPKKLSLRHEFEKQRWNPNEPFNDYHHDKIILANLVPISDEETFDYIVDSIPDFRLRKQARINFFSSTTELLRSKHHTMLQL